MRKVFLFFNLLLALTVKGQCIAEGEYVIICSVNTAYVVDLGGGSTFNGNVVALWQNNRTSAQRWRVTHDNGAIVIRSVNNTNFAIDTGSRAEQGVPTQLWEVNGSNAQRWYPEEVNRTYILRSAANRNLVLDLSGANAVNGGRLQLWEYNGTNAQRWTFYRVDDFNASPSSSSHNQCYQCNNTGRCSNCGGRGYVYNPVGQGSYATCYSCNGSGVCSFCR